ncbi:hypothetical protein [Lentilactobacillus kisonensis]|nr:hypothetical protein [Lentilactobacillus kisonensis]
MTKISNTGKYQYLLKMTKTNHYLATMIPSQNKNVGGNVDISVRYYVGGQDFYVGSMSIYP